MGFTLGSMYWVNPKYSLDDLREDMRRVRENRPPILRLTAGGHEFLNLLLGKIPVSHSMLFGYQYTTHNTCPSAPGARSACRAQ